MTTTQSKPIIDQYDRETVEYLTALVGSTVAPSAALVERVGRMAAEIARLKAQVIDAAREAEEIRADALSEAIDTLDNKASSLDAASAWKSGLEYGGTLIYRMIPRDQAKRLTREGGDA